MKYHNRSIPLHKLTVHRQGPIKPLCNYCETKDCTHQIEKKKVSIIGVNKDWRVIVKGSEHQIVIECEGFSADAHLHIPESED